MNSIATELGDSGQTRLIGGAQASKSDLRVEAYGAIDELGAAMGYARSIAGDEEVNKLTKEIQRELFLVAGSVANPQAQQRLPPYVTSEMIERIHLLPRWMLHPQLIGLDGEEIETRCELKGLSLRLTYG